MRILRWVPVTVILCMIGYFALQQWENLDWLVGSVLVLTFMVMLVRDYFKVLCPICGKSYALKETGRREGSWWKGYQDEFECKHCGHAEWRGRPPLCGG